MSITSLNTTIRKPHFRHQHGSGFTLVEVLVTIVVVSIGLLGLAGLQINGLRANMSSETRSKATLLASDIVERMRANLTGVDANAYSNIIVNAANCAAPAAILCGNTSAGDAVNCTAPQMAAFDVWVWGCGTAAADVKKSGVTNLLPNGTASVTCNNDPCSPGSPHTVTVSWSELSPTDGEATPQTIRLIVVP